MKIEKGTYRMSIVGERTTLKFPRIRARNTIRAILWAIDRKYLYEFLTKNEKHFSLSQHLLRGWLENIREWRLSHELTGIVVPTRLSILGLINIQDTSADTELTVAAISDLARKISIDTLVSHGVHTTCDPGNFGIHNGVLKLRNYGELGLDFLLKNYGEQFKQAFAEIMVKTQAR